MALIELLSIVKQFVEWLHVCTPSHSTLSQNPFSWIWERPIHQVLFANIYPIQASKSDVYGMNLFFKMSSTSDFQCTVTGQIQLYLFEMVV